MNADVVMFALAFRIQPRPAQLALWTRKERVRFNPLAAHDDVCNGRAQVPNGNSRPSVCLRRRLELQRLCRTVLLRHLRHWRSSVGRARRCATAQVRARDLVWRRLIAQHWRRSGRHRRRRLRCRLGGSIGHRRRACTCARHACVDIRRQLWRRRRRPEACGRQRRRRAVLTSVIARADASPQACAEQGNYKTRLDGPRTRRRLQNTKSRRAGATRERGQSVRRVACGQRSELQRRAAPRARTPAPARGSRCGQVAPTRARARAAAT